MLNIPLQQITCHGNVKLYVLRLDNIGYYEGGNKYFKLKYNLAESKKTGHKTILTFGGAWSNHLAAVAAVCSKKLAGGSEQPEIIAVVRGEESKVLSDTLRFCKEQGVQLYFVSRED